MQISETLIEGWNLRHVIDILNEIRLDMEFAVAILNLYERPWYKSRHTHTCTHSMEMPLNMRRIILAFYRFVIYGVGPCQFQPNIENEWHFLLFKWYSIKSERQNLSIYYERLSCMIPIQTVRLNMFSYGRSR